MGTKNIYGPDYKKPWVRRTFPHQRTHLSDHREVAFLLFLIWVAVAAGGGLVFLLQRAG